MSWEGLTIWAPWIDAVIVLLVGALVTYAIIAISDRRDRCRRQRFLDRLNERSERDRDRSGRHKP